jgi:hypothetical protein
VGDFNWWRWGAYAGLVFVALNVLAFIAGFSGGAPPSLADTSKFANALASHFGSDVAAAWFGNLSLVVFVPFLVSVRQVIRAARGDWEWSAGVVFGAGISWLLMRFIHNALLAAAAVDTTVKSEPVAIRALFEAGAVIGFTFLSLFAALFIVTTSYVVLQSGVLPRWTAWVGYVAAALNFLASFLIFSGGNPFGGPIAYGSLFLGLLPVLVWAVCISIAMLGTSQAREGARVA